VNERTSNIRRFTIIAVAAVIARLRWSPTLASPRRYTCLTRASAHPLGSPQICSLSFVEYRADGQSRTPWLPDFFDFQHQALCACSTFSVQSLVTAHLAAPRRTFMTIHSQRSQAHRFTRCRYATGTSSRFTLTAVAPRPRSYWRWSDSHLHRAASCFHESYTQ